ncbi:MAG TPA: CHAD domain-containing protein [Candidatus Cybelea sp.]|nr:CHAD domain-containing protein [Candidatus Cybelea sp.]
MKPAPVDLRGARGVSALAQRVLQTRLSEACALAGNLARREKQGLHEFRIACKRLRYALERFASREPELHAAAERLALLQDALGEAHDRDVLLSILPPTLPQTERTLREARELYVDRASVLWPQVRELAHACALMRFE